MAILYIKVPFHSIRMIYIKKCSIIVAVSKVFVFFFVVQGSPLVPHLSGPTTKIHFFFVSFQRVENNSKLYSKFYIGFPWFRCMPGRLSRAPEPRTKIPRGLRPKTIFSTEIHSLTDSLTRDTLE